MYELGVHSVKRSGSLVSYNQMTACLMHLLTKGDDEKETMRRLLIGNTLAITGQGQPCHIGDDGSIVIPWNCL